MGKPADRDGIFPEGPSKSQIKRELSALQEVAERMTAMAQSELEPLGLSEATRAAIDETPRIKDQRARRRHFKRIAKLLARENMDVVHALAAEKDGRGRKTAACQYWAERWRERLIEEGDEALGELLDRYPGIDRQRLRQLMRASQRDREGGRPEATWKMLRFLRQIIEAEDLY